MRARRADALRGAGHVRRSCSSRARRCSFSSSAPATIPRSIRGIRRRLRRSRIRRRPPAVRRRRPVAAAGARSGSSSRTGSSTRTGRSRSRSAPTVIPTRRADCGDARVRRAGGVSARDGSVGRIVAAGARGAALRLRVARRDRVPEPQGGNVVRVEFVPDAARHEARDRDYFFVLGFLAWGMWAGMGAIALAQRYRVRPRRPRRRRDFRIALNWGVVTRRPSRRRSMPRCSRRRLLDPLPPRAVLFVAGDNDTYPLWYAQQVEGTSQGRHGRHDAAARRAAGMSPSLNDATHLVGANRAGDPMVLARRIAESASGRPVGRLPFH